VEKGQDFKAEITARTQEGIDQERTVRPDSLQQVVPKQIIVQAFGGPDANRRRLRGFEPFPQRFA